MSSQSNDLAAARAQWQQTIRRPPPKNDIKQAQEEFIKWKLANQPNDLIEARLVYEENNDKNGMRMRGDNDGRGKRRKRSQKKRPKKRPKKRQTKRPTKRQTKRPTKQSNKSVDEW